MKDTFDTGLQNFADECNTWRTKNESAKKTIFPLPLTEDLAQQAVSKLVFPLSIENPLLTDAHLSMSNLTELEDMINVVSTLWSDLAQARCQYRNNLGVGAALQSVPQTLGYALVVPSSYNISPSVHVAGHSASDPFMVKMLNSHTMTSFLDQRIYKDSHTDMDENARWTDSQSIGKYPISAIEFSRIADRNMQKKRKIDTETTVNEIHVNQSEGELGRDDDDDEIEET